MRDTLPKLGFIGAGRVGTALSTALAVAGYPVVAVASRARASADALVARLPAATVLDPQGVVDTCDLVLITTPDAAIQDVAASLRWREGVAVVHTSGVEWREALAAAATQGTETASLHPLQTFADLEYGAANLSGSVFAIEAEGALRERLLAIVAALGGTPLELRAEDKALYHASAAFASNYVVTLASLATSLWARFGWEEGAALAALLPLMRGAVSNLEALGLPAALTGPVARGDVATVQRHLDALTTDQAAFDIYRTLAHETVPVALAKGGLGEDAAAELRALLRAEAVPK